MLKIICVYKQQVLPIWKDKDKYYCVFIKEDIHRSQHPVCNSSLDKILELYKDHIDSSKYITSEDYDLELEVNYKDEVRNYYNLSSADNTITGFINQVDNEKMKTTKNKTMKVESRSEALKVNYNGYTLEIEEVKDDKGNIEYYTANCAELPYFPSGIFKTDLAFIIENFKRIVHVYTFNQLNKKEEEQVNNCNTLAKQILEDFPNSADNLCDLLLDFKYKLEEGIGQKE